MAYLQNGVCFKTEQGAKADFLSRVPDFEQRAIADRQLKLMSQAQVKAFFPDCSPPDKVFNDTFMAILPIVVMCIIFKYLKAVALV